MEAFEIDDQGARAAVLFNVAGRSEMALLDLQDLRLSPVKDLAGEIVGGLDFSRDGTRAAASIKQSR